MRSYLSSFLRNTIIIVLFINLLSPVLVFAQDFEIGKALFKSNCTSCHYLGPEEKKLIGPGLNEEIFEEHSEEWLFKWIRNSSEVIESGDKVAKELFEKYNKAVMTAFPHFSDDDITNILKNMI